MSSEMQIGCIQAVIEAAKDIAQRYEGEEIKTIAMDTAIEHIRDIVNETEKELTK